MSKNLKLWFSLILITMFVAGAWEYSISQNLEQTIFIIILAPVSTLIIFCGFLVPGSLFFGCYSIYLYFFSKEISAPSIQSSDRRTDNPPMNI